jgi:hypothetical protein
MGRGTLKKSAFPLLAFFGLIVPPTILGISKVYIGQLYIELKWD